MSSSIDVKRILARGRVPLKYQHAQLAHPKATSWRYALVKYLSELPDHLQEGRGLYLYGERQSGKKAAGCITLVHLVQAFGKSVLYIDAEGIRRASVSKEMFDESSTVWERAIHVDALLIVRLGMERETADFAAALGSLIDTRKDHSRLTLFTSYFEPQQIYDKYGPAVSSTLSDFIAIECKVPHGA